MRPHKRRDNIMVADMEVGMVTDMEVNKVADKNPIWWESWSRGLDDWVCTNFLTQSLPGFRVTQHARGRPAGSLRENGELAGEEIESEREMERE